MGWLCKRCGAENQFKTKTCWCCSKQTAKSYRVLERLRQFGEYLIGIFWVVIDAFVPEELYIGLQKWNHLLRMVALVIALAVVGFMIVDCIIADLPTVADRISSQLLNLVSNVSEREEAVPNKLALISDAIQAKWPKVMNAFPWNERQGKLQNHVSSLMALLRLKLAVFSDAQANNRRLSQLLSGVQLDHDTAQQRWNSVEMKLESEQARRIEQNVHNLEALLDKWQTWSAGLDQPSVAENENSTGVKE